MPLTCSVVGDLSVRNYSRRFYSGRAGKTVTDEIELSETLALVIEAVQPSLFR
jgi:hypothetical protein